MCLWVGAMGNAGWCSTFESRLVPGIQKPTRDGSRTLWGSLLYLQNGLQPRLRRRRKGGGSGSSPDWVCRMRMRTLRLCLTEMASALSARESQPPAAVEHRVEPDGSKFAPATFRAYRMDSNRLVNDRESQEPAATTRPDTAQLPRRLAG